MNYAQVKKEANEILLRQSAECSYIEYKKSGDQLAAILKTLCAYGNNYYENDRQFVFIGVEEAHDDEKKAVPVLPIAGIDEGRLELVKNQIKKLRSFLYPNVAFEIITNELEGRKYLLVVVPRQAGGPFMVSDRAEREKSLKLKPGRYIRVESDSRLASVVEEYDLLRKFANFHFSSQTNAEATIDDLNTDYLTEYVQKTSGRQIMGRLEKAELAKSLQLVDKNDPAGRRVKNFAVLMFADRPDQFIPYAFTELIIDRFGTKRRMESKQFAGPVWKQYDHIVNYINDNFLSTCVIREDGVAENRQIANFPFVAVEELVANALVHNNYENGKAVQIYITESQINIVNYNRPLPPLKLADLNERSIFNERDTENPELRDMFKRLGIIEAFGTGIGEAKRAMQVNGSPDLYYKEFAESDNVTSVVIPASDEYWALKSDGRVKKESGMVSEVRVRKDAILGSGYAKKVKANLLHLFARLCEQTFSSAEVRKLLKCSETTATAYVKKFSDLGLIAAVAGEGKGKYRFRAVRVR